MLSPLAGQARLTAGRLLMRTTGLPAMYPPARLFGGNAASAPEVRGVFEPTLRALAPPTTTLGENLSICAFFARFGYGTGTTAGPTWVGRTSGSARLWPLARVQAG